MKALILVGGFGTRLRPLTLSFPKPLVEFCNKAIVLHQIEALAKVGVDEVILAVNYRPELMTSYLSPYEEKLGIKITYSQEFEPLGTAGPLALAKDILISSNEPFFVLNSDVICKFPLNDLVSFHKHHGKEGTILVTQVQDPSRYGVIVSEKETGKIKEFVEKPQTYVGNEINAGIYILNPSVLKRIKPVPTSIEKEIFPLMAAESELFCFGLDGFWMDVGQPGDYLKATGIYLSFLRSVHPESLSVGPNIKEPVLIDPTAKIGNGCSIGPNVCVGPNCVIEDGVHLSNTAVLGGVRISANSYVNESIIGWESTIGRWVRMDNLSVLGQDVHVRDCLYVNGAKILPHKTISDTIPEPRIVM